jgi:hypothetical protein
MRWLLLAALCVNLQRLQCFADATVFALGSTYFVSALDNLGSSPYYQVSHATGECSFRLHPQPSAAAHSACCQLLVECDAHHCFGALCILPAARRSGVLAQSYALSPLADLFSD